MKTSSRWMTSISIIKKSGLYTCLLLFADTIAIGIQSIVLSRNMSHYFTLLTMFEAALLFLIGGAIDVTGSITYRRIADRLNKTEENRKFNNYDQKQIRAIPYIATGIILLALSFVLAYPIN